MKKTLRLKIIKLFLILRLIKNETTDCHFCLRLYDYGDRVDKLESNEK